MRVRDATNRETTVKRLRLHSGRETTQLGYGCASLMGRLTRSESVRLLDAAYAAGIRHVDVARSYGYGQAEDAVGDLLRRHDDITVTTKCGIAPPASGVTVRFKPLIRAAIAACPPLRPIARRRAEQRIDHGAFDPQQTDASLRQSLAALGTDRVDVLLLHEVTATDLTEPLLDWLQTQVATGRVGAYGTATTAADTAVALTTPFADVVQVAHTLRHPDAPARDVLADRGLILHSVLRDVTPLRRTLDAHADLRADVTDLAVTMTGDPHDLGSVVLAATATKRADAVVLCASRHTARIRRAVEAVEVGLPPGGTAIIERWIDAASRATAIT